MDDDPTKLGSVGEREIYFGCRFLSAPLSFAFAETVLLFGKSLIVQYWVLSGLLGLEFRFLLAVGSDFLVITDRRRST